MSFALTKIATPVLNTPHFDQVFSGASLPLDDQNLLRPIETVLFPGTKVEVLETHGPYIVQVRISQDYPCGDTLYIDRRFLCDAKEDSPERPLNMPPPEEVLIRLKERLGERYIWGGNVPSVPELFSLYPPAVPEEQLSSLMHDTWQLKGCDCSGLVYWATNGCTPRNTSRFLFFGKSVAIAHMTASEILLKLRPLDALVWQGHVVLVLNALQSIESRIDFGVVTMDLHASLSEILAKRKPVDEWDPSDPEAQFVVRRWHPDMLA